jgi:hypothetical protein
VHGCTVTPHNLGFRSPPACEPSFKRTHSTDTLFQYFLGMVVGFIDELCCLAEVWK